MENNDNGNGAEPNPQPQYIGNYEVLRTIGRGKFAIVYRARKIGDENVVALKRISVDMMNEKAREKCLKEVRLLQNLDHPNIIRYMDSFITDNDLIIVYEWAAAGDLKRQLKKAQEKGTGFDERVIWKYFSQICLAIQHMHEKRVMHRDLKPANIFLTLDGTIKVGDLGLSRELSADTIQAHSKVGTPLYMSPEVLKGDGYDFKSDVWSLGCLLYELAMLKSPFKAEGLNMYSLFEKISNGEYLPLPDNYSEELRNLAYSMINIRPEDRPEVNQVVEIAKRMRQQTATVRSSSQRESSISSAAAAAAATDDTGVSNPSKQLPNSGLSRTPSKTAIEAKEEVANTRESRSRESNPYGRRPDSEEDNTGRRRYDGNEEKRDRSVSRDRTVDNEVKRTSDVKSMGLDDYFNYKSRQEEDQPQRNRSTSVESRNRTNSADEKPPSHPNNVKSDRVSDVYPTQQSQQIPSSSSITQSNVVRRSKASNKGSDLRTSSQRPLSGRQTSSVVDEMRNPGDRSQVVSRERPTPTTEQFSNKQPTNPEEIAQAGQALALMEIVYSKLIVLGYNMDDPDIKVNTREYGGKGRLLPIHFACDPKAFGAVAGHDRGYVFNPLSRLIHIALFLCEKINTQSLMALQTIDREFGAPMTSAKQLLLAAQRAGEFDEHVAAITPTSVSQGYGYNVCLLLNHFADCALKSINYVVKLPVHDSSLDALEVPLEDNDEEIEDLEVVEGEDDDGPVDSEVNELAISASGTLGSSRGRFYFAEMTTIDPELWRQEAERVAPLLKKHEANMTNIGGLSATWRTHLDMLLKHVQEVVLGQSTKKNTASSAPTISASMIAESIGALRSNLQESLQKIQHSEKLLTSRAVFTGFSLEYEAYKKELDQLQQRSTELNTEVSAHNEKLAEIEEHLEEASRMLEEKTSGDGVGGNASTTKFKEAIRTLQEELQQMHITISILNNDLLQRQKESSNQKRSKRLASKKKRLGKNDEGDAIMDEI